MRLTSDLRRLVALVTLLVAAALGPGQQHPTRTGEAAVIGRTAARGEAGEPPPAGAAGAADTTAGGAGADEQSDPEPAGSSAESPPGLVTDADGAPLEGVTICLAVATYKARPAATTDADGAWVVQVPAAPTRETYTTWPELAGHAFSPVYSLHLVYSGPATLTDTYVGQPVPEDPRALSGTCTVDPRFSRP